MRASEPAPLVEAQPKAQRGSGVLSAVAFLGLGAGIVAIAVGAQDDFGGSIEIEGGPGGAWIFTPSACASGYAAEQPFMGAVLRDASGATVTVTRDRVVVRRHGAAPLTLDVTSCARFDVSVELGDVSVNRIEPVDGHAGIDCDLQGSSISGELSFDNCTS